MNRSASRSHDLLANVRARNARTHRALQAKARYLNAQFPTFAASLIQSADEALEGRLILPGTMAETYFVGDPPDWTANPVDDNEYVWSLNRMGHWKALR